MEVRLPLQRYQREKACAVLTYNGEGMNSFQLVAKTLYADCYCILLTKVFSWFFSRVWKNTFSFYGICSSCRCSKIILNIIFSVPLSSIILSSLSPWNSLHLLFLHSLSDISPHKQKTHRVLHKGKKTCWINMSRFFFKKLKYTI